jgi:2-polyprenyl-3-methyl-5-hydroxy-6-metoxy-1,4-benzoquinol methylase
MSRPSPAAAAASFGRDYFERYYGRRDSRVASDDESTKLCRFIHAYAAFLAFPVRSILDVGAGTGRFMRPLKKLWRDTRYTGIDLSEYACRTYGWQHKSILDLDRGRYDLVLCHDVLQYLDRKDAVRGIERLAARCRGLLYFSAMTSEDWRENVDRSRSDREVHLRSTRWYRRELGRHFRNLGGGVFAHRDAPIVTYSLHEL